MAKGDIGTNLLFLGLASLEHYAAHTTLVMPTSVARGAVIALRARYGSVVPESSVQTSIARLMATGYVDEFTLGDDGVLLRLPPDRPRSKKDAEATGRDQPDPHDRRMLALSALGREMNPPFSSGNAFASLTANMIRSSLSAIAMLDEGAWTRLPSRWDCRSCSRSLLGSNALTAAVKLVRGLGNSRTFIESKTEGYLCETCFAHLSGDIRSI